MRGLFSDRFLRRFVIDLKYRQKHPNSRASEEDRNEEVGADITGSEANDAPNKANSNLPAGTRPSEE